MEPVAVANVHCGQEIGLAFGRSCSGIVTFLASYGHLSGVPVEKYSQCAMVRAA
jgi:hypothetical protein